MQNQLIPVNTGRIGNIETLTVNARDLHGFLELRSQFGTWMQNRIRQYGFRAGVDFELLNRKIKQASGTKHAIEYRLTLDMGKELSMVERNDKGREARRYFIDCEKRLLAGYPAPPAVRPGQVEALRLDLAQENGDLRDALREQAALIDDLKDELLDVYRSRSPVRKVREKIVYKVPTAALELMVEYRIPRDRIAAVSGLTRLCLRQHIHNAREAGRLQ